MARTRTNMWSGFGPIVAAEAFLSFTVFIFAFGPWPWSVDNPIILYSYLIAVQVALLLGYLSGSTRDGLGAAYTGRLTSRELLNASVILNLLWIVPYFYLQIGPDAFSLTGIIGRTIAGVANPRQAYSDKFDQMNTKETFVLYAYMLCSPVLWLAVPLAVRSWRSISKTMKVTMVFLVLANAATWVALGTTKGIADDVAIIAVSIAGSRQETGKLRRALMNFAKLKRTVLVLGAITALVLYFSYTESSRKYGHLARYDSSAGISIDLNNIFIAGLPDVLQAAEANAVSYLCQGYYGLSLALQEPFVWSYGIGHSVTLTSIVNKVTGFDASQLTYMAREQHAGWDMQTRWDSIYPWLASDVTFPGTLVIIFLIGRLLASTWADVRAGHNPFALPLFVMVMIMIFYFPANDQILSSSISIFAFWGLLFAWAINRTTKVRFRVLK